MKFFKEHLLSSFFFLSALASIISLFFPIFQSNQLATIALLFFVATLIILLFKLILGINEFTETSYPEDYSTNSSFIKYSTFDGIRISYEVYKSIQCKRLYKTYYEYDFKWSGKNEPKISSKLQNFKKTIKNNEIGLDKAILEYPEPLYFNQSAIIHFLAELNDPDQVSKPYVCVKIDYKINILHFRIELKHRNNIQYKIERRKIDIQVAAEYELLEKFNVEGNSFEYHLINPEIGYFYRIVWDEQKHE
ncbi:MAG: hypothetical protein ACKVOU_14435 [Cytophagales bacterium]